MPSFGAITKAAPRQANPAQSSIPFPPKRSYVHNEKRKLSPSEEAALIANEHLTPVLTSAATCRELLRRLSSCPVLAVDVPWKAALKAMGFEDDAVAGMRLGMCLLMLDERQRRRLRGYGGVRVKGGVRLRSGSMVRRDVVWVWGGEAVRGSRVDWSGEGWKVKE